MAKFILYTPVNEDAPIRCYMFSDEELALMEEVVKFYKEGLTRDLKANRTPGDILLYATDLKRSLKEVKKLRLANTTLETGRSVHLALTNYIAFHLNEPEYKQKVELAAKIFDDVIKKEFEIIRNKP